MGIGAVFGAILTMYTAVATRAREIATLRALGFNTFAVLVSVLAESMALALVGGVHRRAGGVRRLQRVSDLDDEFPDLQPGGVCVSRDARRCSRSDCSTPCVMGLIGGLLPAIRAARLPIASALREL